MLLGVQTSFCSAPKTSYFLWWPSHFLFAVQWGMLWCVSSLLGWVFAWMDYIYSCFQTEALPFLPFTMWAVLGLSFAVRLESVRFCFFLNYGNILLIHCALFFPSKRLVYTDLTEISTLDTCFLHSLDRSLLFINAYSQFQFFGTCFVKKCYQFHFAHCIFSYTCQR